jgi:hemoglobin/transferrin/lactoferrin receptor protein
MRCRFTVLFWFLYITGINAQNPGTDSLIIRSQKISASIHPYITSTIFINKTKTNFIGNTADIIESTGTAFSQKSQAGGGSIVIRGFEASRILMVVDNIRLNNAIYRAGHLQNIVTIDPYLLESITIHNGNFGTLYGSDALGGVVHMKTKTVLPGFTHNIPLQATINASAASATQENRINLQLAKAWKKLGSITLFTYSKFGEVVQGSKRTDAYPDFGKVFTNYAFINNKDSFITNANVNKQVNTSYTQYDAFQKFTYANTPNNAHQLQIHYSNSTNIPRTDRLLERNYTGQIPSFAAWYYGPQKRLLTAYEYQHKNNTGFFNEIISNISYQQTEESRYNRRYRNYLLQERIEKVNVYAANIDFVHKTPQHNLHTGLDVQFNNVNSSAQGRNVLTQAITKIDTRYPNGKNHMLLAAAFATYAKTLHPLWNIQAGARLNYTSLVSTFNIANLVSPFPFTEAKQKHVAPSGNISLSYHKKTFQWNTIFSTGFRAPNIDDLGRVFESTNSLLVIPNANVKPEYTKTLETNIGVQTHEVKAQLGIYYTSFTNAIALAPSTLNGQATVLYNGAMANIVANTNINNAYIYGLQANAAYNEQISAKAHVELSGNIQYTYGRISEPNKPKGSLDHIPPLFGSIHIKYNYATLQLHGSIIGNGAKLREEFRLLAEDNENYATASGSLGWSTINIDASCQINKHILIKAGVNNLLDKHYRVFASGISAPGRNIIVNISINI